MKRKYYLRGLGFGVLITSLVFILTGQSSQVSDEEVIRRAGELGYIKAEENQDVSTTPSINLDELLNKEGTITPVPTVTVGPTDVPSPTTEPASSETPVPEVTEAPGMTETPVPTVAPIADVTPTPEATAGETPVPTEAAVQTVTPTPAETDSPAETPVPSPSGVVTEVITAEITVVAGVHANVVSAQLEAAGIIEDADAFSLYLMRDDSDNHVVDGTYTLSSDMTFEELARILTRKKKETE